MLASDALQRPMRWAAGAHVVFCVNFEESSLRSIPQDRLKMLMLETRSGQSTKRQSWKAETTIPACVLFLHDGVNCRPRFGLVPTFRSSCYIAALTFTNFGKSWALANL